MFFLFELCHLVKFAMDSGIGVGFMDVLCIGFRFILFAYGGCWGGGGGGLFIPLC